MGSPKATSLRVPRRQSRLSLSHENRVLLLFLAGGLVPLIAASMLLIHSQLSAAATWVAIGGMSAIWLGFAAQLRATVVRPLRTLASLQAAVRAGDFSIRARPSSTNDSLSELMFEINELSSTLQEERLGAFEAGALMRKILSEIDIAVFAFDSQRRLRVLNRAAERLIGTISERAIGISADKLGIGDLVEGEDARTMDRVFPGASGRWGVRRTTFRQGGVPHQLVVVSDLSRALREEERKAWQRLVRVLGHELNNSLAPIKSISHSLLSIFRRNPRPQDWEHDLSRGLQVIAERSDALGRFISDYSRLAQLPKPNFQAVAIGTLLRRIVPLENRAFIKLTSGPEVVVQADADQIQQLLVNILRNAVDASVQTKGIVEVSWRVTSSNVDICITDEGAGLANAANLFVPFFTTKPGGSGIGLPLCRQIAEAHGGRILLNNRDDRSGCQANIVLPITPAL